MNVSFNATDYFKINCPAAVHSDGTTRAQIVSKNNADFYQILNEYEEITGLPALINTSFNIHEEPIVCTPEDAVDTFRKGKIDYLAINNFLIEGGFNEKR